MKKLLLWARYGLAVVALLALGYRLGAVGSAKASGSGSSEGEVQFQLTGVNETSSLLVYQPGSRTVYVYRGATTGNSNLQCNFMFRLGAPGGAIQRVPCAVQTLLP